MKHKYIFIISILFLLNACQSIRDGLAGNKNNNSDEFLIEKKNPLETPPEFGMLPEPKKEIEPVDRAEKIDENIEILLKKEVSVKNTSELDKSTEDFILKKIKKN